MFEAIFVGVGWSRGVLGEDKTTTGGTGPWCWIKIDNRTPEKTEVLWMLFEGKFWEILCYLITFGLFVWLKIRMVRTSFMFFICVYAKQTEC